MALERTAPDEGGGSGRLVFAAQRGRSDAIAAGVCGLVGAGLFALAVSRGLAAQRSSLIWIFGLPALLLFGGVAFALVRRYLDQRPILKLSDAGLKARGLARPLRWEEIDDVEYDERSMRLVVHLPRSAEHRKTRQFIPLRQLPRSERLAAFTTVLGRVNAKRIALGRGETRTARDLREVADFDGKLDAMTPRAWALQAVVALNVGVWLVQVLAGVPLMQPATDVLFRWGGNSASAVVLDGETWRLLTATVLHAGVVHLALNMAGLWYPGRQLARMLGNGPFLLVYLATALCGSAASLHFAAQRSVSVGASGAVFGVLGALVACGWRHREKLPMPHTKKLWSGPGVFMLYALVQGLASTRVDNAAHVGGLLAGIALGLLLVPVFDQQRAPQRNAQAALGAMLALVAVGVGTLATPLPHTWHGPLFETVAVLRKVKPEFQRLVAGAARSSGRDGSDPEARAFLERDLLPGCASIQDELAAVRGPEWEPVVRAAGLTRETCALLSQVARTELAASTPEERRAADERNKVLVLRLRAVAQELKQLEEPPRRKGAR
ncbi:rhomboid family protein [Ramlibacter algicola]|uniref:Rhomboid family intramembrane serine protease n=1 Tax=Ramlibacter algicola TaxID=2795217 RepID=A0A934Q248_9BURK|nr:rhomboid family intramembrane serine protease [Ramlibacter algicola]MBK0394745.1 rhomboid family intramembrane serine protease [Ramlibacter algicola]